MRRKLPNEVYIFTSPGEPGIRFYDRSPEGIAERFAGPIPKKTYQTDILSIVPAAWNPQLHKPNRSILATDRSGSYTITTFIVPPQQLISILRTIESSEDKSCIHIEIQGDGYSRDSHAKKEELEALKEELLNKITSINHRAQNLANNKTRS